MKVYLDNGATTKLDEEVKNSMIAYFDEKYGNASSLHTWGEDAREALDDSRETIAKALNSEINEIVFTSGGTESNNFAIKGVAFANQNKGKHIITTKVEHDCVLNATKYLKKFGFETTYISVDKEGFIKTDELKKAIKKDTILVSIIHGNNEIGTIQNLEEIGNICKENNVLFHTDACQSFTKVPIDTKNLNIDLISINAHKIHGPKGVGALYIKQGTPIDTYAHGGGHEFNKRSGTENIPGIVGFAKTVEVAQKIDFSKMSELRDHMIKRISEEIKDVILTGPEDGSKRLQNNVNFIFKYIEGEGILMSLNMDEIAVSTGSACSSHSLEPSHVMIALGFPHELAHGSIRFSLSKYTTKEEIDYTVDKLKAAIARLRSLSPLTK